MTDCRPERSEAESKDPVELLFGLAAGFLDFARNDVRLICPSSFDLPSSFGIRDSSLRFEHFNERLLRNVDFPNAFHPLFSFFLFLQQFALPGDIAAVAFRGHIFS
jgi:hypothetical protein